MEITIRHAVQDDWPAVHEIFQQDHVLAGTQRLPYAAPHVMRERMAPRFYELQFREHFRMIREQGLIGLTSGRLPAKGRGHVTLHILELPFRDGGAAIERFLHAQVNKSA